MSLTNPSPKNTFSKAERLKSKKVLDHLSAEGKALIKGPFLMLYTEQDNSVEDQDTSVQIAISASKRRLKKATDRNRVKRLVREAYRKNKHPLIEWCKLHQKRFALLFIYRQSTLPDSGHTDEKIILLLKRLMQEYEKADK